MMPEQNESLKSCILEPIPEIFEAAAYLAAAAKAHRVGNFALAEKLIADADILAISAWTDSIWGKVTKKVHGFVAVSGSSPLLPIALRPKPRMPTAATKRAMIDRDGFHCRFCGIPVIRSETRLRIRLAYPNAARWGKKNAEQHAALQCLWLQYDHLLPNQRGGSSDLENMAVTCAPCNFGRMQHTLEEARLMNPLARPLDPSWLGFGSWCGLEDF